MMFVVICTYPINATNFGILVSTLLECTTKALCTYTCAYTYIYILYVALKMNEVKAVILKIVAK